MRDLILLLISYILVSNVVLSRFLGLCPFLGVSKKVETASGMGIAVVFVITLSSILADRIYKLVLIPTHLEYMQTIVFILLIAALVQFVEMFMKKNMHSLYESLGVYLPLINVAKEYNFAQSIIYGVGTSCGFALSIVLLAGIREKINESEVPFNFRGMPIVLVTAGLMAIAFCGFSGLI